MAENSQSDERSPKDLLTRSASNTILPVASADWVVAAETAAAVSSRVRSASAKAF